MLATGLPSASVVSSQRLRSDDDVGAVVARETEAVTGVAFPTGTKKLVMRCEGRCACAVVGAIDLYFRVFFSGRFGLPPAPALLLPLRCGARQRRRWLWSSLYRSACVATSVRVRKLFTEMAFKQNTVVDLQVTYLSLLFCSLNEPLATAVAAERLFFF